MVPLQLDRGLDRDLDPDRGLDRELAAHRVVVRVPRFVVQRCLAFVYQNLEIVVDWAAVLVKPKINKYCNLLEKKKYRQGTKLHKHRHKCIFFCRRGQKSRITSMYSKNTKVF